MAGVKPGSTILVRNWWRTAEESLASAESDLAADRLGPAVSRLYYSMFYALMAALTQRGQVYSKHKAVPAAFHRDYVRNGRVERKYGELFEHLFHARHEADYTPQPQFQRSVVSEQLRLVREFLNAFKSQITSLWDT